MTPFNWVLLMLMAFCGVAMIARFALGLGGSTHLSDTYPWGLWILFDLVWIAVAAGAFAMAGMIYVFQRKDLYSARPKSRADGSPELLVRHRHARRRPRPALALLSARAAGARPLGDVRGLVVRRPLRHDPRAGVPAGALGAMGPPPGRWRSGRGGPAPTWRSR